MTKAEVLALKGRDLDVAVAASLGWTDIGPPTPDEISDLYGVDPECECGRTPVPHYRWYWSEAGPLLERLVAFCRKRANNHIGTGQALDVAFHFDFFGNEPLTPELVCRAWLLAKMDGSGDL